MSKVSGGQPPVNTIRAIMVTRAGVTIHGHKKRPINFRFDVPASLASGRRQA